MSIPESGDISGGTGRRTLATLMVICVAPMAIAWWMYSCTDYGRDGGAYSHGILISPPVQLPNAALQDPGSPARQATLHGRWNLVALHSGECREECARKNYTMQQLWLAMGESNSRLQRVLFLAPDAVAGIASAAQYRGQLVLEREADYAGIWQIFKMAGIEAAQIEAGFFIIDPQGYLIMRYPADADPGGILKDLKRLFRYSRSAAVTE